MTNQAMDRLNGAGLSFKQMQVQFAIPTKSAILVWNNIWNPVANEVDWAQLLLRRTQGTR